MDQNSFNFSGISSLVKQAGPKIAHAIEKASVSTGVDFAYLMKKAAVESSFKADAKNSSSSATGLYQFVDKTWMSMVKKYGDKYGMGHLADKIDNKGHCNDPAARRQILALRKDPEKAACMAAEYDSENRQYLQGHTNTPVGATEMYFAHFMGAGGATSFLNDLQKNPAQNAAKLFPQAAAANPAVFYDEKGKARNLAQVYDFFSAKFQGISGDERGAVQVASAAGTDINAEGTDVSANALQRIMGEDADSANAMVALLSPSKVTHPKTITRDAGTITWNGPRAIVSPDTARLAMMTQMNLPLRSGYGRGYDSVNS